MDKNADQNKSEDELGKFGVTNILGDQVRMNANYIQMPTMRIKEIC